MRLYNKQTTTRNKQLALVASCLFIFLLTLALSGCSDDPECVSCPIDMVCNPTEEYCECTEGDYRLFDYYHNRWICQPFRGHSENDTLLSYNFLFNGNQFGVPLRPGGINSYNHLYNVILLYNKVTDSYKQYNVGNPINSTSSQYAELYGKPDPVNGDSVYIYTMFLFTNWPHYEYQGQNVWVTGRGRVSPDKDTLDMTVYFLDKTKVNYDAYPDKPISVDGALDIRKMTLLSSRVLPKY